MHPLRKAQPHKMLAYVLRGLALGRKVNVTINSRCLPGTTG
jgi:hypothetical protein